MKILCNIFFYRKNIFFLKTPNFNENIKLCRNSKKAQSLAVGSTMWHLCNMSRLNNNISKCNINACYGKQMERLEQHTYITSAWDNPLSKPIVSLYCFFSFSIFSSSNNYVVSLTKTWKSTIECSKFKRNCMVVIPDEIIIIWLDTAKPFDFTAMLH